jgi:hypothetical protein
LSIKFIFPKKTLSLHIRKKLKMKNMNKNTIVKGTLMLSIALLALFSCQKESSEKQITEFSLASVAGTIDETRKTIAVELPYGTDITALTPVIQTSGKTKITPAAGKPQDFTQPVVYTVAAADGSTSRYTVTVTIAPNTEARIIAFAFKGFSAEALGVIDEAARTITVVVPFGTDVTNLQPGIALSVEATVSPADGAAQDFTSAVEYTVTAGNGSINTYQVFVVVSLFPLEIAHIDKTTVTRGDKLTLIGTFAANNNSIDLHTGNVTKYLFPIEADENASSITVTIPATLDAGTYTLSVTANGNEVFYDVPVHIIEGNWKITSFLFSSLNPVVEAVVDDEAKTITATVPFGTDVTGLSPAIELPERATVHPASGVVQNFTHPVEYTVTASDRQTYTYTATVNITPFGTAITEISKTSVAVGESLLVTGTFADAGNLVTLKRPGAERILTPYQQNAATLSVMIAPFVEPGVYTLYVTSNGNEVSYPTPVTVTEASSAPKILALDKAVYLIGTDRLEIFGINFPDEGVAEISIVPVQGGTSFVRNVSLSGNIAVLDVVPATLSPGNYELSIFFTDSRQHTNSFPVQFIK